MKALRIFTALLLIFFVLNYWCRKLLPFAYADVADYSLLYTTNNSLYVKKLQVVGDSLEITFNDTVRGYTWWDGTFPGIDPFPPDSGTRTYRGNVIRYKPSSAKTHELMVWADGNDSLYILNVNYNPANTSSAPYEVTSHDLVIEPAVVHDIADWPPDDWASDNRVKQNAVARFVFDSSGIINTDNTAQKILKIGEMVLRGMPDDNGQPSASLSALHPMQQYKLAKTGRANLWCGNYAAIFSSFANSIGIPTRTVFTGTSKENLGLGNHVFCEAYIKEEDCWAYVDLTSNTVLLTLNGRYLNVVDVQRLIEYPGGIDKVVSYSVIHDKMATVEFHPMATSARYYFTKNTFFTFFYKDYFSKYSGAGVLQKIKNLFLTRPMYAVYSDNLPGRNYHFLARVITNYLLAAIAILWLIALAFWLLRMIRKRK